MILASQNIITGQDASSPLLLATFTPTISGEYFASVNLSLLAGTGVYRLVSTRQIGGVGAIYQSATAAVGVSAGITTLMISTIPTPLLAGDVLKIYVQGLAGDTAIDGVTEIFRSDVLTDSDLTPLAKTTHLQEVEDKVDAVKAKTDNLPASPAAVGSAMTLSSSGVYAILDEVVVGSYTLRQLVKVMAAALAGKVTGGGTSTITFRGVDDTTNVIVATVDTNGNRSAVTLTV